MGRAPTGRPGVTAAWDTIVLGGGPAGSTAATLLARAGQKVLVLERDAMPRFHVGESLIPYGNDALRELGVWEKMEQAGFMPKWGAEFTLGNAAGAQRFSFGRNLAPRYAQTFQVERARFDELLLRHAESCGATVQERAKVSDIRIEPAGASVSYDLNGKPCQEQSRWIIDASGRASLVGRALGLHRGDLDLPKRLAIFAHFENAHRSEGERAGDIVVARLEDAWCWFIPLDKNRTSVGLVQRLDAFKSAGLTPEESFRQAEQIHSELRFRLRNARRVSPFHTEGDYTFRYQENAGSNWLMTGDAAGFIDPIFSSGVMLALRSSQLAARAILKADAGNRRLRRGEQRAYSRQLKKMADTFLAMIRMFYDRSSFEVFMCARPRFDLRPGVLNIVGGNTDLPWSLRWQVWGFYLLCRLQRFGSVVPRLNFQEAPRPAPAEPVGGG